MDSISPRDVIPYTPGRNASDTLINGVHFNLHTLKHWNYTLYSNSTLSNGSSCYLTFSPYTPAYVFANGSFTNATSCFTPTNPIAARGITSLVLGTLFAATVLFTLINLRKHGRCFLPRERRWSPVGRRTQWYWMLFVAACGAVSAFTAVDVDRDYLQGTALILQSFFYTLMLPGLLACVWEGVRNWYAGPHLHLHLVRLQDVLPYVRRGRIDLEGSADICFPLGAHGKSGKHTTPTPSHCNFILPALAPSSTCP